MFSAALEKFRKRKITSAEVAKLIENGILPQWEAARLKDSDLLDLPSQEAGKLYQLMAYQSLRKEAWAAAAEAFTHPTPALVNRAKQYADAANNFAYYIR